jgi:hypothetical protein
MYDYSTPGGEFRKMPGQPGMQALGAMEAVMQRTPPAMALPPTARALPILVQGTRAENMLAEPLKDDQLSANQARGLVSEYAKDINRNPIAQLMQSPRQLPLYERKGK